MLQTVFSTLMSIITILALIISPELVKQGYEDILIKTYEPVTIII
jgi:hypothetical protein